MKTAVRTRVRRHPGRPLRLPRDCLCAGLLLAIGAALAAEPGEWTSDTASFTSAQLVGLEGVSQTAGPVIQFSSSNLPRFDNFDGSNRTQQRVDMALLSPGKSAFGVTMGVTGLSPSR